MGRAKKETASKAVSFNILAPLVAVGGVLQQNVMGAARSPRAGDAREPRIGLKWAGEARPFQGFAPQIAWTRNRAVRGRYESRSNTLAPLVAVGGVLQQNVMGAARSPRAGDAREPRIGLKWAGEARPFQGFAPQIAWTRNRAVRGRYESRSNTLAPLVAVGGVLQ